MAPKNKTSLDEVRAFLGFALIGLANTILPAIIHAANYLIVPYPRPVVTLIELLPVIAVKLSLPFFVHRVPYRVRPLVIAACWLLAKKIADDTPPNVPPPVRILMSVLAAVLSAATEVSCLGMVGAAPLALAGWGFGTGAGLIGNAVWPFILAHKAGKVIRSATKGVFPLVVLLLLSHFVVLPSGFARKDVKQERGRDEEERRSFIEVNRTSPNVPKSLGEKARMLRGLVRSEMVPLFAAAGLLSLQQGVVRTLDVSVFGSYSRFAATFGVSVHLGTLIARSSVAMRRVRDPRAPLAGLTAVAAVALLNAVFLVSTGLAFCLAFLAGLLSGAVYIDVLARLTGDTRDAGDREFAMGAVTAGDAGGMIVGSLFGALLEMEMCGHVVSGRRWCHQAR